MVISAAPLIYILIFIGVLALVQGIYLTVFGKSISLNNRINRRLDKLEKGAGREQVLDQLRAIAGPASHVGDGRHLAACDAAGSLKVFQREVRVAQ